MDSYKKAKNIRNVETPFQFINREVLYENMNRFKKAFSKSSSIKYFVVGLITVLVIIGVFYLFNFTEIYTIIGMIGGLLTLTAFFPYTLSIIRVETKPKQSTWWIWTLNSVLVMTSYRAEGAQESIWLAVAYVLGCGIVALLSLKYGVRKWSKVDRWSLIGTFIAIVLWIVIGPIATLIMSLIVDLFGVVPTIRASFYHPEEEDRLSWIMWLAGGLLSLLSIENLFVWQEWSLETLTIVSYPAQISITTAIIVWFLIRQKSKHV